MARLTYRFKHYDLGQQPAGTVVEVALSCINNIRLMDTRNLVAFKEARKFKYFGGKVDKSPIKLAVPTTGHWHLVVDRDGFNALAKSNVRIIRKADQDRRSVVYAANDSDGANQTKLMGDLLRELDEYKQLAVTDALTKLNNRRAFDQRMEALFDQQTTGSGLVLMDIDHFKSFNDTHGHAVGDLVLSCVAETLRIAAGEAAFVARTGGEEFAIILQNSTQKEALSVAERVRDAIENMPVADPSTRKTYGPVTVSLGLCMSDAAANPMEAYNKADTALYQSKETGRNRCTVYIDGMASQEADVYSLKQKTGNANS